MPLFSSNGLICVPLHWELFQVFPCMYWHEVCFVALTGDSLVCVDFALNSAL